MMKTKKALYALTFGLLCSQSALADIVATPDNEDICKRQFSEKIFEKQIQFSSSTNSNQVRRSAERMIDNSREVLQESNSYCQALDYIVNKAELEADFKRPKSGETMYKKEDPKKEDPKKEE